MIAGRCFARCDDWQCESGREDPSRSRCVFDREIQVVKLVYREQEFEVRGGRTLGKALEKCQLNPHVVLAVREGKLITEDVILHDGDEIKLVAVISGG